MEERFKNWEYPQFDENNTTKWNWVCQHPEKLKLGVKTDIGAFTYINAKYGVHLGDNAQIGAHCAIYSVSTIDNKTGGVSIGENAKVGAYSLIMPGVSIGENSVIGAYSFVNHDIPPNVLAYGIPVKIIKELR